MAKKFKLCMFCGTPIVSRKDLTMEHFVPKGLWEDGHRPRLTKTLPAHKSCNGSFADDNDYFRDVLAMEEGAIQRCEAARIVSEGALRRKLQHHTGGMMKTARNLRLTPVVTQSGLYVGDLPTYEVDTSRIYRVLQNVMKGIFYQVRKVPMPTDFVFYIEDARKVQRGHLERLASDMVPWQGFGDDAFVCRYRFLDRPHPVGIDCLLQIYRNRIFFGQAACPAFLRQWAAQWAKRAFVPSCSGSAVLVPPWAAS